MIVFLTVIYIVVLAILIKVGVLKPTQLVKLSPIAWMILLLVVLFIPMQFGAPSGDLRVFQNVIQIVSQVSGRVVEVPVQPNVPVRRGDVLFRVDPRPYQFQVDKLEAVVADAGVNVSQLAERSRGADAGVEQAQANFLASQTDFDRRAEEAVQQAEAVVMQVNANLGVARANFARFDRAAQADAVSRQQLDASRREVESLEAQLLQSEAALQQARLTYEAGGDRLTAVREQVVQAEAQARETRLAYEAQIEGVNPRVHQTLADLEGALRGSCDAQEASKSSPFWGFVDREPLSVRIAGLNCPRIAQVVSSDLEIRVTVAPLHDLLVAWNQYADHTTWCQLCPDDGDTALALPPGGVGWIQDLCTADPRRTPSG